MSLRDRRIDNRDWDRHLNFEAGGQDTHLVDRPVSRATSPHPLPVIVPIVPLLRRRPLAEASQKFLALELEVAFVNRTDIYRQAIKRTFADLYGVSPGTVDVSWTTQDHRCAVRRENVPSSNSQRSR